jgi:hypothetical protein
MEYVHNGGDTCIDCRYIELHDIYRYMGYCEVKYELMMVYRTTCNHFSPIDRGELWETLETGGWLYCIDCGEVIFFTDELKLHLDHRVRNKLFSDIIATEESPAAD